MWRIPGKRRWTLLMIGGVLPLLACPSAYENHFDPKHFETQDEAGSGHIAVL
ncbi:MAG: hypothetical protein KDB53_03450 [Planctomycetes bacterium]|nr:hypothetical protein [Planctomycetota bacterium]